ncbi:hypothetical protein [Lachnotalea glycerini]|uniref:SAP domain-containing protein n=1 Tax=Lachnotalea glycerini TaxID=1763509 RepID=A0A371J789_9FIRM|nr:hypothetical protein [Lachnotalea glycerini]RDY28651.1 hypothetical protein CG710_019275 [Lachnotalea glycerini]
MIQIIKGTYGYKEANGTVTPKTSKDGPFSLTEEQEARLIKRKVAVAVEQKEEKVEANNDDIVDDAAQQNEITTTGNLDREQLESMSYNDVKKLASDLGVPATGKKDEIIEKLLTIEVEAAVDSEDDQDEAPVLTAAEPEEA